MNVQGGGYGGTALHGACFRRHPDIVRILLKAGASETIKDFNGMTAFEIALWTEYPDMARAILEHSTSLGAKDIRTFTALASNKDSEQQTTSLTPMGLKLCPSIDFSTRARVTAKQAQNEHVHPNRAHHQKSPMAFNKEAAADSMSMWESPEFAPPPPN